MRAVGIILAGGQNAKLKELTQVRATSAMPIGSSYRAIDFSLSNMANSGISKVAIITQYNSRSLHDHLNSSKWWGFGDKIGGMFVFSPFLTQSGNSWFRGTADSIYQNMAFLKRSNEPYVLIASGDCIYKMDYNTIIEYHMQKNADITVVCKDMKGMDVRNFGVVELDGEGRVVEFEEKPLEAFSDTISLGIYVIRRELLIELLETIIPEGRYDFVRDIVVRYRKKLNIMGFICDGYWASVNSVESYYNINMDFLRSDIRNSLFFQEPYIETKNKDEPPAKYNSNSQVKNSLIGSGSIIDGIVENSVLFRRVRIGEKAIVRDSIIMEGCEIGYGCIIENAILDKDVLLTANQVIRGSGDEPFIVKKNSAL
ncbi:MAG: glucose-1-phosphate adenylyltransferase subunit GlgD [Clostridiales bacterium]|jgi:glucose-1-phosphate adenylyltransferase|nr:glucose-1-phosphate adenylyltransferase subunit GlgD [Clostridiales bacterium]